MAADEQRVDAQVRHRAMASTPLTVMTKLSSDPMRAPAFTPTVPPEARPVVHAVNLVARKRSNTPSRTISSPPLSPRACSTRGPEIARGLLVRLEKEVTVPESCASPRDTRRGAWFTHAVVTAAVMRALIDRLVRLVRNLLCWQAI